MPDNKSTIEYDALTIETLAEILSSIEYDALPIETLAEIFSAD